MVIFYHKKRLLVIFEPGPTKAAISAAKRKVKSEQIQL
jgi:hypothetical protein